ncbi:hypothetical protein M431DRAFT_510992 [Trichoderma harzianum CBS 226.95]|uniref:Uncharacterized protein n=1 Tax=Trichoderma harzianum CBS 226.95 TaxID=983964 RepID=A0A2T4A476_TRIHA|nr:hypothetical protein M431DRAFT_510992 [Trichoderma harzianum CBS 226.95]PTB51848.1 hypothetical protein M431DRAFT_510992 [Trichoderma harzianum CBS 226.95]
MNDKTKQVHVLSIQLIEFLVVLQVNYLSGHPVVSRSRVCFLSPDLTEGGPISLCFNLGFSFLYYPCTRCLLFIPIRAPVYSVPLPVLSSAERQTEIDPQRSELRSHRQFGWTGKPAIYLPSGGRHLHRQSLLAIRTRTYPRTYTHTSPYIYLTRAHTGLARPSR